MFEAMLLVWCPSYSPTSVRFDDTRGPYETYNECEPVRTKWHVESSSYSQFRHLQLQMYRKRVHVNLLPQQNNRKPALTDKQEAFWTLCSTTGAMYGPQRRLPGTPRVRSKWLKDRLADEIIERTKTVLAGQSLKAANKLVSLGTPSISNVGTICG